MTLPRRTDALCLSRPWWEIRVAQSDILSLDDTDYANCSNGDLLDDVAGDASPPPIVDLSGAGMGVPDQVLDAPR